MNAPIQTQVHLRPARARSRAMRVASAVALALLLFLCAIGGVRTWLRHSMMAALPPVDGTLSVAGLSAPVRVERDAHGVPHIIAQNVDDLVFAQAYITAQDRLWQMDMLRRHAAGELAEVLGSSYVEHDRTQRYLQLRESAERELPNMSADERHSLERYAQGVNAAITASSSHLPAEFRLIGYDPKPWSAVDSLLVGFAMAEDLSTSYPDKLNREAVTARLSPELAADLYPVGSFRDRPAGQPPTDISAPRPMMEIPLDESQASVRTPEHLRDLMHARDVLAPSVSDLQCDGCAAGSNNWVVSGERTRSGRPMVSNDMHLAMSLPGIWYTADLEAPGIRVAGVSLPGTPFIIVGHNDHVAWGFTNSMADVQDLYQEQIANGQFRGDDGAMHPLHVQHEVIRVHHGLNVSFDVQETQHGDALTPVLSPLLPHEGRALALRWILYEPDYASAPFFRVDTANSGAELVEAFRGFGGPSQNLVYGDDAGHIGYHLLGRIPLRGPQGQSGISPVPVAAGSYEWSGFIPFDQLPAVTDPAGGVLASANARVTPDGYPYQVTLDWMEPYRNERIWKLLEGRTGLTAQDMLAVQDDVYSALDHTFAHRLAYAVDHTSHASKQARQAADLLRVWDGRVTRDSAAANLAAAAREQLMSLVLTPHLGDATALYTWHERSYALELLLEHTPARWLPSQYTDWNQLLTAALEQGIRQGHAPGDLKKWAWGNNHRLQLASPVLNQSWWMRRLSGARSTRPEPMEGNAFTVRAFTGTVSASERFTADLGDVNASTMSLPAGESGNPRSPWYLDQWPVWYSGTTIPLPYSGSTGSAHTLLLMPADANGSAR